MKIVKIKPEVGNKRISIEGFNKYAVLSNGVLTIDDTDFMNLEDFILGVYYS